MVTGGQANAELATRQLEKAAAAAALKAVRSSFILLYVQPNGALELTHCSDLVLPSERWKQLVLRGIDPDAPLTSPRYAFATVTSHGQLLVGGNSEQFKTALWTMLMREGACVQRHESGYEIQFASTD